MPPKQKPIKPDIKPIDVAPLKRKPEDELVSNASEKKKLRTDIPEDEKEAVKSAIRSKANWWMKVRDQEIRKKWISEAISQGLSLKIATEIFQDLFNEAFSLLKFSNYLNKDKKKKDNDNDGDNDDDDEEDDNDDDDEDDDDWDGDFYLHEEDPPIPNNNSGVGYIDGLVPDSLKRSLEKHLDFIASSEKKDFHPGAEGKVQDLIHPSLFPYVEGQSFSTNHSVKQRKKVVFQGDVESKDSSSHEEDNKKQTVISTKKKIIEEDEEDEDEEDDDVLTGEPEYKELVEKYFPKLSKEEQKERMREFMDYEYGQSLAMFAEDHLKMYKQLQDISNSVYQWLPAEFRLNNGVVTIESYINNLDRKKYNPLYNDFANLFNLFIPMFVRIGAFDYNTKNFQVIVKAANYILDPGQTYEGSWHVEGTPNEHIIASGIYYYHVDKQIAGSNQLAFRDKKDASDDRPNAGQSVNFRTNLGKIDTIQGRCLVFRNHLQHKVRKLENNTNQQVQRKIICFFSLIQKERFIPAKMCQNNNGMK
jgi:hypothetical protein